MFLIAYMATKDPSVAIISAVALLVTLQTLSAQKTAENVVQAVQSKVEGFRAIRNLRERFADSEAEDEAQSEVEVRPEVVAQPEVETEIVGAEAETEVLGAPVESEGNLVQPEVPETEAPPACGASLDDMTGYESGEFASF
jgi:hypothetical protein